MIIEIKISSKTKKNSKFLDILSCIDRRFNFIRITIKNLIYIITYEKTPILLAFLSIFFTHTAWFTVNLDYKRHTFSIKILWTLSLRA